ncbi:hypothetical protein [Paracidovorax citrulli]|uniref:hypothetical protein n=1 Tax=Paracidovorax citrulli TaxID=80869 RepID=UPI000B04EC29|nr:hypothetical protein [Paracidovorax citrulli]
MYLIQKNKKIAAAVFLASTIFMVMSADYGRYRCDACAMPMNPADVRSFIGVYVNPSVSMWAAKDTVSICNGITCVQYMTPNQGTVWSPKYQYPDPKTEYKGSGIPLTSDDSYGPDPNPGGGAPPFYTGPISPPDPPGEVVIGPLTPAPPICYMTSDYGIDGCP